MEKLIEQLRTILGTNFGLYFKIHSYHWNVEGPDFVEYHTYLGNLYTQIFNNTDLIAEKLRALETYTPVSLTRMKELSDIEEDVSVLEATQMFQNLVVANDRYIIHLRAGIVAAEAANEPAIGNFLQDILDQHQKHAWFLKSITK
jgi:starvation-inducible DNA-binding protein